ncbi:hypothetical protein NP493_494g04102 [Ridgeia piscesae]|uniref:Fe2OG dioxygenase domain-containing protein n=1 Tax=Ridgeia piscesae TaxID=27915 RepID=A0AAD9NR68_RIDPI|nr:hypothetical protein NP493_494g04102 [Ridgeia piscesae]
MASVIPIVDLEQFNICKEPEDVSDDVQRQLAAQIIDAFSTVGFVGLKNYGIPQEKLAALMTEAKTFFYLPETTKRKYPYRFENQYDRGGWCHLEQEILNYSPRLGDLKETFDVVKDEKVWPDDEVPGFRPAASELCRLCFTLSQRVLLLIGIGLGLEDPSYLKNQHSKDDINHVGTLRCLYYPPIRQDTVIKPGQTRCGEHSDYGFITLIFQDDAGGLELRTRDGEFVPATPMDGVVLVNVGDLMQRWTSDKLVSTIHRVVVPETRLSEERLSVAFFTRPNFDYVIKCLDGSDKYEPITSFEQLTERTLASGLEVHGQ